MGMALGNFLPEQTPESNSNREVSVSQSKRLQEISTRRTYDYYCSERKLKVSTGEAATVGSYFVCVRFETLLLNSAELCVGLGLVKRSVIPINANTPTIDTEKTFHCAASKNIMKHVSFTLKSVSADPPFYPTFGEEYTTTLPFSTTKVPFDITNFLETFEFKVGDPVVAYKIIPGTIKYPRSRKDGAV